MTTKILVIDDDLSLLDIVRQALTAAGYSVAIASNAEDGLRQVRELRPALVLLDIMMPGTTGWEACARIRKISNVPCIFLTARSDPEDKVKGLDLGADDYIVKPFHLAELRARVEAVLRRARVAESAPGPSLSFGDGELVINKLSHTVMVRGQAVALSPTEYRLLLFLAERPGRVLTTEQIHNSVWGGETETAPASAKWYIWRLRRKIESASGHSQFIVTVNGVGYRFCAE